MSIKQAIEALESCDPGDYSTGHVIYPSYDEDKVNAALAALRSMPAEPVDKALNTLCKMLHSGEEVEGDDGLAMLVPMDLWNEAQEAIELLVGEDDATPHTAPLSDAEIVKIAREVLERQTEDGTPPAFQLAVGVARAIERAVLGRGGEKS